MSQCIEFTEIFGYSLDISLFNKKRNNLNCKKSSFFVNAFSNIEKGIQKISL